ncbi:MAG: hypothetical protein ACRDS0_21275 [Pseudonocardiaceae bacterium]
MTCVKLQDSISEDEIVVHLAGAKVLGPIGVHKGKTVSLGGLTRTFTGSINVQLFEIDSNSAPDDLGTEIVRASEAGSGDQNLKFDKANKAFYTLNYRVA